MVDQVKSLRARGVGAAIISSNTGIDNDTRLRKKFNMYTYYRVPTSLCCILTSEIKGNSVVVYLPHAVQSMTCATIWILAQYG